MRRGTPQQLCPELGRSQGPRTAAVREAPPHPAASCAQDARGTVKYVGGEHYLDRVPTTIKAADLVHRLAEKANHSVSVRYQVPGEPLDEDELVAVSDDVDMEVSSCVTAAAAGALQLEDCHERL